MDKRSGEPHKLERRAFLKIGSVGLAASVAGCAPAALAPPEDPTPSQSEGTGPETPAAPPSSPDVGDLVDPSQLRTETWQEPWTWRPERWPDEQLHLNVVERQNPGPSPSTGNPAPSLFSYNGISPGPTIRVRNDGTVRLKVRNMLGLNEQQTQVGPSPDPVDMTPDRRREVCALAEAQVRGGDPENPRRCFAFFFPEQVLQVIHPEVRPGWSLKGHVNGQHAAHVTNLHTHGLHVAPVANADGTHSDNVLLRIIPHADAEARFASDDPNLHTLGEHEHVGELSYTIHLGFERDGTIMAHPPGTHWYHPHSHGATHDQVASGMAGFLLVEGDVDEAVNLAMTGKAWPDPEIKTGPFDYRERLVFVQRVFVQTVDLDVGPLRNALRFPPFIAVNGVKPADVIFMRPGAVERWRVLNGSVDGAGTKRYMILKGQYVHRDEKLWRVVTEGEGTSAGRRLERVTQKDLEEAKMPLHQLSFDGITLVTEKDGIARHAIRDLSLQNAGTENPFVVMSEGGEDDPREQLRAYESCFKDGDSLRRAFVRPNELYLGNANRADIFFKAPLDSAGETYTVFAQEAHIHTDNFQFELQRRIQEPERDRRRPLFDVVVAYVHVRGEPVEGGDFDIQGLNDKLPPVPPLLQPVKADELIVSESEARRTGVPAENARTRVISYSGMGGADFPFVEVPEDFARKHPELKDLVWGEHEGVKVLLPNLTRTMAINTEFDLASEHEPDVPRKFMPDDPRRSRVLVDTAEEWVLYNCSQMLWSNTDRERFPQPGSYGSHFQSYPITRAEGQRRFWNDPQFRITNKGADHPFHIHINPMWVLRIDVPDENGRLHNILPEPQWMDTVSIPRNGGRVVFRTRFDDFVGTWVHHCHILLHEDMGMMQVVECTDRPEDVNYRPRSLVASSQMTGDEVDVLYPPPSLEQMYRQNMAFIDPNEIGFQEYPGFDFEVPSLDDDQGN